MVVFSVFWGAVSSALVPLCQKTIRLFKHESRLSLSAIIPRKLTVLTALILTGFTVWQVLECRNWSALCLSSDLPERIQAGANLHLFYAMVGGLALFCTICILIRQLRAAQNEKQHHS